MEPDVTEGQVPTQGRGGWPTRKVQTKQGSFAADAAQAAAASSAAAELPTDAIVSTMAHLVFVTTGQAACDEFGEFPVQVALTSVVARRIAEVLRVTLEHPDLESRQAIATQWQADEQPHLPHGRLLVGAKAVGIGIEPLGAGALITIGWNYVPAFILQLEAAVARIR